MRKNQKGRGGEYIGEGLKCVFEILKQERMKQ